MSTSTLTLRARRWSIISAWLLAVIAAVVIGLAVPFGQAIEWFSVAFGACVAASFVIQLATGVKEGFVQRVGASVAGAALVLIAATVVFWLLSLFASS